MKRFCFILISWVYFIVAYGQTTEYFFSDNEQKTKAKANVSISYGDKVILGGVSSELTHGPSIICIDTLGNEIWNTGINDSDIYPIHFKSVTQLLVGQDSFLYVSCRVEFSIYELWKVNLNNGDIIWKKRYNNSFKEIYSLHDIDNTKFLIAAKHDFSGNGNTIEKVFYIDKQLGDTLNSFPFANYINSQSSSFSLDYQGNFYYTRRDTIFKRNLNNPLTLIWAVNHSAAQMFDYQKMHIDTVSNHIILFGARVSGNSPSNARIVRINSINGSFISFSNQPSSVVFCEKIKVINNFIYAIWTNRQSGSGSAFYTTKYNVNTDQVEWFVSPTMSIAGSQSALDFELDNNGGVFLTGFCGASFPTPPSIFSIIKLNDSNGAINYQKIITLNSIANDEESAGIGVHMFNGIPYFIGQLQTEFEFGGSAKLAMVKLNPTNGDTLFVKFFGGRAKLESKLVSIQKFSPTKTLLLKEVGHSFVVEMLDFNNNVIWKYSKNKAVYGKVTVGPMTIDSIGNIYVAACYHLYSTSYAYYSQGIHSSFVYKIDSLGNQIQEIQMPITPLENLELYTNTGGYFLVKGKNSYTFGLNELAFNIVNNINANNLNSGMNYEISFAKPKRTINLNQNSALVFTNAGSVLTIDKNTSTFTSNFVYSLGQISNVYYINVLDSARVLLCGKSNNFINKESIALYNYVSNDTIWTNSAAPNNKPVLKSVVDSSHNFVYTIAQSNNDIAVRKRSLANGSIIWSYIYSGNTTNVKYPLDIEYDSIRDEIIVAGYRIDNSNNKQIFILKLDSLGSLIDNIVRAGDFPGDNIAYDIQLMNNGAVWVGGNLNSNIHGTAGIIIEVSPPLCFTSYSSYSLTVCDSIIWNNNVYYSTGLILDTLVNVMGCDSVITLNLIVSNSTSSSHSVTACDSLLWNSNVLYSSGIYIDTLTNAAGCDSIVTLNLTINNTVFSNHTITACDSLAWNSNVYYNSGVYIDTTQSFNGCDSIVTLNLFIDTTLTASYYSYLDPNNSQNLIIVNTSSGNILSYLWDFGDGNTSISQYPTHTYATSGNYYICLTVFDTICSKTYCDSALVRSAGIISIWVISPSQVSIFENKSINNEIQIYPNPTREKLFVMLGGNIIEENKSIVLYNYTGKKVLEKKIESELTEIILNEPSGLYFINIINENRVIHTSKVSIIK